MLIIQLEDLFVDSDHRGKGLGKRLFGELGKLAVEKKCGRVEWRVLKVSNL
jgi:GNAT superfamily N-acetyltransferase